MRILDVALKALHVLDLAHGGPQKRAAEERAKKGRTEAFYRQLKDHSLSCNKCGGLAEPISGTKRNYRCSCGHQFSGSNHPL